MSVFFMKLIKTGIALMCLSKKGMPLFSLWLIGNMLFSPVFANAENNVMYFCTAANSKYYWQALNLIGSIQKLHFNELGEIAVYNLGLTDQECDTLNKIRKVKVYEVEKTNQDIIKPFVADSSGRTVPGWYAWKPVIIKQTLDQFPYVFYLDAGQVILRPLNSVFEYIKYHGYFMCDNGCTLGPTVTKFLIEKFNLEDEPRRWILDSAVSIDASKFGISRDSFIYKDLLLPVYEMSKDLRYFEDDGSAKMGFGGARYDQSLISIYAMLLHLDVLPLDGTQQKPTKLKIKDEEYDLFLTWRYNALSPATHIYHSRRNWAPDLTGYIVWNH